MAETLGKADKENEMTLTETIETLNETGEIIFNIMADEALTLPDRRELIEVIINEAEQKLVTYVSRKRYETNRATGATATIYNDTSAIENEMDSFGAEVAYCKLHNCYPDLATDHRPPFDATLPNGKTVDVKQTKYTTGKLLVKLIARAKLPDLYALMIGKFPKYKLAGHIEAKTIITPERIQTDSWKSPAYVAKQDELK